MRTGTGRPWPGVSGTVGVGKGQENIRVLLSWVGLGTVRSVRVTPGENRSLGTWRSEWCYQQESERKGDEALATACTVYSQAM